MQTMTISVARKRLPWIIDRVSCQGESVLVTRRGKAVATIVPVKGSGTPPDRHPLRGVPITLAPDFDAPLPELWESLQS
jgi:antitoxin (DNA-binding transcriptional repressor) of toxin-antitoxin stability system